MKYITGQHALNLVCPLDTPGDWHTSALQWKAPQMADTASRFFGEYGIFQTNQVPENPGIHYCANHIRAILDLLEDGNFALAQGMRDDYICVDGYNREIFNLVYSMRILPNWTQINEFMGREYMMQWVRFTQMGE